MFKILPSSRLSRENRPFLFPANCYDELYLFDDSSYHSFAFRDEQAALLYIIIKD